MLHKKQAVFGALVALFPPNFHLLKNVVYVPLLVLKGISITGSIFFQAFSLMEAVAGFPVDF